MLESIWEDINGQLFPLALIGFGIAVMAFIGFIEWLSRQIDSRRPHRPKARGFEVIERK